MRTCFACGTRLRGRQQKWCSDRCKKRVQRHPERYPELKKGNGPGPGGKASATPLLKAAKTGDALKAYQGLRDRLALEIDEAEDPRAVAALAARLVDVVEKIDLLNQVEKEGSSLDELRSRREARRSRSG